jgi:hypothetical protein
MRDIGKIITIQGFIAKFLLSFKEFPPPISVDEVLKTIFKTAHGSRRRGVTSTGPPSASGRDASVGIGSIGLKSNCIACDYLRRLQLGQAPC